MTTTFLEIGLVDAARLSSVRPKKDKIYKKDLTKNLYGKVSKLVTCFVFYKNLLCRLRSACLRHDVNNSVKCK